MTDEYFMTQALKEAKKAFDEDEVPIGGKCDASFRAIYLRLSRQIGSKR